MEMDSILFTFDILTVPAILWLLMLIGQIVHIGFKIQEQTTEANFAKYITSGRNQFVFFVSLVQSVGLLIAGWYGYDEAQRKYPNMDLDIYVGGVALAIGYMGSSLWTNIMSRVKSKAQIDE